MNCHFCKNGTEVYVTDKKDFEYFVKKFNKKVQKAGVLSKVFEKRHHEPPNVKRKRKEKEARSRLLKEERKDLKIKTKERKEMLKGLRSPEPVGMEI